jgi:hypothetical protein
VDNAVRFRVMYLTKDFTTQTRRVALFLSDPSFMIKV